MAREKPVAFTPEGRPIFGYNAEGQPVCYGWKRKKKGKERCLTLQVGDNGRCRLHGKNAKKGAENGNAKHLNFSKYFPKTMQKTVEAVQAVNAGLDLSNELEALRVLEVNLIQSLNDVSNDVSLKQIEDAFKQVQKALKKGDKDAIESAIFELGVLIKAGAANFEIWEELRKVIKDIARVASVENRRKATDASMMSIVLVRDINFKALAILKGSVVNNIEAMSEDMLSDIRLTLLEAAGLETEQQEKVSSIVVRLVREHVEKIRDRICDDAADGIAALHPGVPADAQIYSPERRLLPSGNV